MKLCMTAVYTHLKFKYGHERIKKSGKMFEVGEICYEKIYRN